MLQIVFHGFKFCFKFEVSSLKLMVYCLLLIFELELLLLITIKQTFNNGVYSFKNQEHSKTANHNS